VNFVDAVVLVDDVSAWEKATVVWSGSRLQVIVNQAEVETFDNVDRHHVRAGKQTFSSTSAISDSDGDLFSEIVVIPQGGCGCR